MRFSVGPERPILDRSVADGKARRQLDSVMFGTGVFATAKTTWHQRRWAIALLKSTPVIITGEEHFVDAAHRDVLCRSAHYRSGHGDFVLGAVT